MELKMIPWMFWRMVTDRFSEKMQKKQSTGEVREYRRVRVELISKAIAQQIVDTVKDVCSQNINFIDAKGIIIASTDPSRIDTFHEIGYRVVSTGDTLEVADDDSFFGTKRGINLPVSYNGQIVAAIGISGEVEEVRKYAHLAGRITDILLKEREIEAQGTQKKNRLHYVIRCLVNNETINADYLTDTLRENGLSEQSLCRVVLIRLDARYNTNNLFMIQSAVIQTFARMDMRFYRYNYPSEYILIAEEKALEVKKTILARLAEDYASMLHIGVGTAVNVRQSAQSYLCASVAIQSRKNQNTPVYYDDLDFTLLLGNMTGDRKKRYMKKILGSLKEEDCELLSVYYQNEMSLQQAADALYIHKNSLQYRLNHIHKLTGYNPRKFTDAVVLYSALELRKLDALR